MLHIQWRAKQTARLLPNDINEPFLSKHGAHEITAMPMASLGFQTIIKTFQMRYCMIFYLKGHQNCQKIKI